ncbi:protein SENSITIVE TO UV 2 isoform X3 [Helianthus annuus]|uniref:protein SENSITIVE TO UV 2 isoform X3 n=1 Tax=Helianthus annuus TaxID=4232 RepID=UPI000B905C9B|nr:protein SENSITIVE TO UV 2 isoform X3 [Helianthus annuus]
MADDDQENSNQSRMADDDQENSNQSRMADDQEKSNQSRAADDQDFDFDFWDDDFVNEAIQLTEAAACSSSSNPTQPPQQQQVFRPPPQSVISYSPPRELSQRVKQQDSDKAFHEDKCSKQQEINRLKEQECSELKKDREKNEKHLRPVLPVNGSEDAETFGTNKSTLKNKDPVEDSSVSLLKTKGGVGVHTDLAIKKNISVSRKLAGIWEPESRSNLVSKLFVACEADLQILFGFLGLNIIPSTTKMASNHCIQSAEAAKVSHLYITLTKVGIELQISYDTGKLGDLLEALVDLCCLQNMMIVHRSLCVLHVVLKHILNMENKLCRRDNVIITVNRSSETVLTSARKESQPLISCSKWFSLFQRMHQVVRRRQCEENIRVEAVSIMNILLLRTDAYTEREMYGEVSVFESIPQLLRKEAGLGVQKQAVHLLYLLLNCPSLMLMFCSSSKEEGTSAAFQVLDGLADCLACHGNGAPTNLVLKLQRNTIVLLAFLASSGRSGFEILLGRNLSRRTNFLYLILQIMASEIDVETSERIQPPEDSRERTLLIREALILLNRLVSNSQYSAPVLRLLTNRRDMAILTVDIASRLSRKNKWLWQSDTMTRQMRESEIVDLARIFKKRVFTFLEMPHDKWRQMKEEDFGN